MKKFALVLILTAVSSFSLFSQTVDNIVENNLQLLGQGKGNQVKTELIDLMAKYPNEPGIRYLLATVSKDHSAALSIYNDIIKHNSESQWADDCYWRLIQYYAITGEVTKAEDYLQAMRKDYPNSSLLMPACDVITTVYSKLPKDEQIKTYTFTAVPETDKPVSTPEKINTESIAVQEQAVEKKPKIEDKVVQKEIIKPQVIKADTTKTTIQQTKVVAKQDIEAEDPPINTSNEKFALQVGVYRELVRAEAEQKFYIDKRIRSAIAKKVINGETMYSVVVGEYSSAERAEKAKRIVEKECNCKPIIVNK
ncbi:MAG: SPOR domain-containing protein [bacterium]